jgi:hypothetical protein
MRYMIIVKTNAAYEAGAMPSSELIAAMGKFNESLIDAGVLLAGEGLQPSAEGARVKFSKGAFTVSDGPFSEARELIGGFWIIDVKSKQEALDWVRRIPFEDGEEVELRKVSEASDFPADEISGEALAREQAWRDEHQKPVTR